MPLNLVGRAGGELDVPRVERVSVHQGALQVDPRCSACVHATLPASRRIAGLPVHPVSHGNLRLSTAGSHQRADGANRRDLLSAVWQHHPRSARCPLAANEHLVERNLRADPSHRSLAGAVCVVVRQADMYISQMGPAVAIVGRGMDARRYPERSVWVTMEQPVGVDLDREPPLGLRKEAEPSLFHASYRADDVLVLASSGIVREASEGDRGRQHAYGL